MKTLISVRLPNKTYVMLQRAAEDDKSTQTKIVTEALNQYLTKRALEAYKPVKKEK
jgi:predicted transcriptional regulator